MRNPSLECKKTAGLRLKHPEISQSQVCSNKGYFALVQTTDILVPALHRQWDKYLPDCFDPIRSIEQIFVDPRFLRLFTGHGVPLSLPLQLHLHLEPANYKQIVHQNTHGFFCLDNQAVYRRSRGSCSDGKYAHSSTQ